MRKLSLMFIAVLILVVMVFAMSHGTALGKAGKAVPKAPEGPPTGGDGPDVVACAKAGGVKAPICQA